MDTHIVERLAEMVANGELDTEYLNVESEHSAMAACIGAQATGVRTFTASSSQGLKLMSEMLFVASGMRLPIVMAVANRSLSAPLNIWNDWSDSIAERDSGWIQLYCETAQEAFDTIVQAYKIAEDKGVLLPVMVCIDGFFLSHVYEPVDTEDKDKVAKFVGSYNGDVIDFNKPVSQGTWAGPEHFQEFKQAQENAMQHAITIIEQTNKDFSKVFGRSYGNGLIETYNMENAKYAIISMGSVCGTIRHYLEKNSVRDIGLIKLKSFRPFPEKQLNDMLNLKHVAVLEKDISLGKGGALWTEINSIMNKPALGFVGGLGGRDITCKDLDKIIDKLRRNETGVHWI